jgi:hypothetical protein
LRSRSTRHQRPHGPSGSTWDERRKGSWGDG